MGDRRIFSENLRATLFNDNLPYRMSLISAGSISLDSSFNILRIFYYQFAESGEQRGGGGNGNTTPTH